MVLFFCKVSPSVAYWVSQSQYYYFGPDFASSFVTYVFYPNTTVFFDVCLLNIYLIFVLTLFKIIRMSFAR